MRRPRRVLLGAVVSGVAIASLAAVGSEAQAGPDPDRAGDPPVWTTLATATVAPGVGYEQFLLTDARGEVRGELLRIDPATPGLAFDLAHGPKVASRHVVPDMMDADAVAAVNGDFFDIRDTEAPLGVAVDRQSGVLNGVEDGWNDAFWVDAAGVPHIGTLTVSARVTQRPGLDIGTVNSPAVRPDGIGLYTRRWGTLSGYRVVDGARRNVRMVIVRNGTVYANRTRFPAALRVHADVLVGRGAGARQLARLRVGQPVTTTVALDQPAVVAVTGSQFLVQDGVRMATDRELSPRTAIGIDHDTGQVLVVVIDGRSEVSSGYSLVQLAQLMKGLGAEDALNLDGGGSSIMVTRQADGSLAVLNTPSDGHPRPVANGLELTYDAPPA